MTRLRIDRLGAAGDGIGELNGVKVFAPFTAPGEIVEGDLAGNRMPKPAIIEPSPDRIKPACPHFKSCGGCVTQHLRAPILADWKQQLVAAALARVGLSPDMPPVRTSPARSRRRAVFAGRRTKSGAMVGFHARASDTIIPLRDCAVVVPELLQTLPALDALTRLGASRKSVLRLSVTATNAGPDVDVVGGRTLTPKDQIDVAAIAQTHGLARLSWDGEVVLSPATPDIAFGEARVIPPPGAFLQATKDGEAALIAEVKQGTKGAGRICDLFAGCGTFTLPLADSADVHAVESNAPALAALDRGWRYATGLRHVSTEARDLFRNPLLPDELQRYDALVLDPPRAGARAQVEQIARSAVDRVIYVSCNPATFARDSAHLASTGYRLDRVQVVDQFLWSQHTELVGHFQR